jgi:hypothetical protein|tara:strand:- start:38 stop:241 length:204 start_codon:yes stop_codon:yes gene_type:complete
MRLLTVKEAAQHLGVGVTHIKGLIYEADTSKRSRWKFGREIIDLSRRDAIRRTLRINIDAIAPESRV